MEVFFRTERWLMHFSDLDEHRAGYDDDFVYFHRNSNDWTLRVNKGQGIEMAARNMVRNAYTPTTPLRPQTQSVEIIDWTKEGF